MGRKKCIVCGITTLNTNVSFHRFHKSLWCDILDLNAEMIPNHSFICSNHFRREDILCVGGKRILTGEALPLKPIENNKMDQGALIELVRQFEHIYNKKHKEFKNKLARENAWKTIASIMNYPREEVETTWNSLRNRFVTERRKMRCTPSGSAATTQWIYYDSMLFLEEHVSIRKSVSNIGKQNVWDTSFSIDESQQQLEGDTQSNDEIISDLSQEVSRESTSSSSILSRPVSAPSQPQPSTSTQYVSNQKKHKSNIQEMKQLKRKRNDCVDIEKSILATLATIENMVKSEENDEDLLFGRSIGESLKLIKNRKLKARVKIEILSVLEKYEV